MKKYASKILFTTGGDPMQVACNYVYVEADNIVNIPVGKHALRDKFDEMVCSTVYSAHPEIMVEIIPKEGPNDFLKSMPYIFDGLYYRATQPEDIDIPSEKLRQLSLSLDDTQYFL